MELSDDELSLIKAKAVAYDLVCSIDKCRMSLEQYKRVIAGLEQKINAKEV